MSAATTSALSPRFLDERPTEWEPMPGPRPRSGFTLLELLVVIVIIAGLMALVSVAAFKALTTARLAAVSAEMTGLSTALTDYKSKVGEYPPCFGLYDSTAAQLHRARIMAHVRRAWPNYDPGRTSPGDGDANYGEWDDLVADVSLATRGQNPADLGNAAVGLDLNHLDPGEAIVFWLTGFPTRTVESKTIGFALNPQNPFEQVDSTSPTYPNPGSRSTRLFEFKTTRLVDTDGALGANGLPQGDGWWEYMPELPPPGGDAAPYVYYDSISYSVVVNDNFLFGSGTNNVKLMPYPVPTAVQAEYGGQDAVHTSTWGRAWPLMSRRIGSGTPASPRHQWQQPDGFQIHCAGIDGAYSRTTGADMPLVFHDEVEAIAQQDSPIRDNLASFLEGTVKDDAERH